MKTRSVARTVVLTCAVFLAGLSPIRADEVIVGALETAPVGGIHAPAPQKIKLSLVKPESVKKEPFYRYKVSYGMITLGDAKNAKFVLALDNGPGAVRPQLYVDANGNGDLTDDPPVTLVPAPATGPGVRNASSTGRTSSTWITQVTVPARYNYGGGVREEKSALSFTLQGDELAYDREYKRFGLLKIGNQTYRMALMDQNLDGIFNMIKHDEGTPPRVLLLIDRNGDGRFDLKREAFDPSKPFRIAGGVYEVVSIDARGTQVALRKSDKKVKGTVTAADLRIGGDVIDFDAETTGKKTVNFPDDYKGKIVMLDFWATWCPPCREEVPNIVAIYNQYHQEGFEILGISLDEPNSAYVLKEYTQQNGMTWPQVYDGGFWKAEVAQLYGINAIPNAFLVDGDTGKILAMGDSLRGEGLASAVQKALASKKQP